MIKKFFAKAFDIVLGILVTVYIVLEELVWENIAEPIYRFIHGLAILKKPEEFIRGLDRHVLLAVFLVLFIQVELLGLFALQLIGTGKILAGTMLYTGKIPVAAFTFWLFRISKEKLMTFGWFKRSYELILSIIEKIKSSSIYLRIEARLKQVKAWLKVRLYRSQLYISRFIEALKSAITF
ncbi:hypothetical protein [Candidatus Methylomicrobium oryzae]|jgi:hypothetical protein|uniref:hypothetical protein n=1 Tax=Candidatus Methylomicrobium oryzae TaxID=2802053 RepID=UPI0019233F8D|nr:hypothetical protein [Methylomicrobium sp. RS1]MBL1262734.1 hypothetical protein [Methylomicrobium sp. RS1]